jgi:hypothetical protein
MELQERTPSRRPYQSQNQTGSPYLSRIVITTLLYRNNPSLPRADGAIQPLIAVAAAVVVNWQPWQQQRHPRTTASTCTVQKARGTHTFKITDYSLHKGIGNCIRSATFTVGGYQWCIRYYPDDEWPAARKPTNRIVVYLELVSLKAEVRAHLDFRLVDHATGKSTPMHPVPLPVLWFKYAGLSKANDVKGDSSIYQPSSHHCLTRIKLISTTY